MRNKTIETDICIVGGGMAGICAAIAAARQGAKIVLVHDRPVYGGNASSEIRVGFCGADRCGTIPNARETGIIEEIRLYNLAANPLMDWPAWDLVLYDMVCRERNIVALMNSTCTAVEMSGSRILRARAWQLNSETTFDVQARIFVDCSGDGVLAELSGAEYRIGREASSEYGESLAPELADDRTTGMTLVFLARRESLPTRFVPPDWAYVYEDDSQLPYGAPGHSHRVIRGGREFMYGYWWVELGGQADSLHDTEQIKHELMRILLGVWDHIKNRGDHGAECFSLAWLQFLPGKREGRRILGDYVLTQNDCQSAPAFPDTVAYGGWKMDVHNPQGFHKTRDTTVFHDCASPYGIPYRCLYSRNINNLMMAGRNISATHLAFSSARVMSTCSVIGQAAGTAAAIAAELGVTPRQVGQSYIHYLQQTLMANDCYLPHFSLQLTAAQRGFTIKSSHGDPAVLLNGDDRIIGSRKNYLELPWTGWVALESAEEVWVGSVDVVFDSDLSTQIITMEYSEEYESGHQMLPVSLPSSYTISVRCNGEWKMLAAVEQNRRRHARFPVESRVSGVRIGGFGRSNDSGRESLRLFRFNIDACPPSPLEPRATAR